MIIFKHRGDLKKTTRFLERIRELKIRSILDKYGKQGVIALSMATPIDTGETSKSWDYNIDVKGNYYTINWTNSNNVNGVPIAILIQYGHGTGNGGYVEGRDYINPAIAPIVDALLDDISKEVSRL